MTTLTYTDGLKAAVEILQAEARRHEQAQADLEAEGIDERCEESLLHAMNAESLRAMAGRIVDLLPARWNPPTTTRD